MAMRDAVTPHESIVSVAQGPQHLAHLKAARRRLVPQGIAGAAPAIVAFTAGHLLVARCRLVRPG